MVNRKTTKGEVRRETNSGIPELEKNSATSTTCNDRDREKKDGNEKGSGDYNDSGRPKNPYPIETGRNVRRPRSNVKSRGPKVKPLPKTPEQELAEAKANYIMIAETVVKAVEKSIRVFKKLGLSERKYQKNGHNLSYGNGLMHPEFNEKTFKVQESLRQLRLTADENCSSIFAHRFFILAVYVYPQHAYAIALTLNNFFNTGRGQVHRNILVVTNFKKFMVDVLNRTTIYDYYLDPVNLAAKPGTNGRINAKYLEEEFPKLKSIRANSATLQKKVGARHLNTATFIGYLISMLYENGSEKLLGNILTHLSFNIDPMNFISMNRIVDICCHLIPYYDNVTSKLLSRLSRFLESVKSDDLNLFKYRCMLREMFENLVIRRDIGIRDQEKIWKQVGETDKFKSYLDYQKYLLKESRREEKTGRKRSVSEIEMESPKPPKIISFTYKNDSTETDMDGDW